MGKRHAVPIALLVVAGLAAAGCGGSKKSSTPPPASTSQTTTSSSSSGGGTLDGTVGPGFDIALKQNGAAVTTLSPGTYTLNVDDQASIHNFHLTGPGVDVSTGVSFTGTKSFTVTLKAGTYHFQCDPHSSSMNGQFTVS